MSDRFTADQARQNSIKNTDKQHELTMAAIYEAIKKVSDQTIFTYIEWSGLTVRDEQQLLKDGYTIETIDEYVVRITW